MFIQILMEYFLEVTGIKKSNSKEGKHVIFLYNWGKEGVLNMKDNKGIWRLEYLELPANEIVDESKDIAREEAEKIKITASSDIDQQINSAREQLRKEVSGIALAGAEQILKREIDAKTHAAVLDELVTQI